MALTLSAELAAAQESASRHPLVDITSFQRTADIPFDGQLLHTVSRNEREPVTIMHSSGRLVAAALYGEGTGPFGIMYTYTDVERTEFQFVDIALAANPSGISIVELANGNIGMTYLDGAYNLRYRIVTVTGAAVSNGTIATWASTSGASHTWVTTSGGDYVVVYVKGQTYVTPTAGGTYTGSTNDTYTVLMTADGTQATAKFKWKKGSGAYSAEITCTGAAQLLAEGVTVTFNSGSYYASQEFSIPVYRAVSAVGRIWIASLPQDGDTVTVGGITYTFRAELVDGGEPYEVKIDPLSTEITLENLHCAIMHTTFEGV